MAKTTVHMVGQAHLDPAWLWRWTEGRAEALATSQSAVERLREYADFHFTRGEAQVYVWVEEEAPGLFAEIVALIGAGRWHVVNGMIVQPDMNLPQGESLVRHFLLGKEYMTRRLGVEPRVAYCVDSFGHAGTLPLIFRGCGCDAYVFMRPGPHEKPLPSEVFWWQAPDGSRVLAFRIAASYATHDADHAAHIEAAVRAAPAALGHAMCFFGVGNHGGGPTRQQIEGIRQFAASRPDLDVRFSSPQAYFEAVWPRAEALPVVADELQYHAIGCYSANSALKRAHRQAECQLLVAERLAALAQIWAGAKAPQERLNSLWWTLGFNQFHDILGGCTIKEAGDEALMALGRVVTEAREIADTAGRKIVARVDTRGPGGALVLFNPFPHPYTPYVECEPWTAAQPWDEGGWGLVDERGESVVHQRIETHEAASSPQRELTRIVFRAELPPLGYRLYRFAPGLPRAARAARAWATSEGLRNEHLAIRLDPASGAIVSCVDCASGLEWVGAGGWNVAQVLEDTSDTWSHGIRRFEEAGRGVLGAFNRARIVVCEAEGPVEASLLVTREYEGAQWQQQIILRAGERALLVRNWLHWRGQWRTVKLAFDLAVTAPRAFHDVPFGWLERPCDGAEVPTQMWADVSGRCGAGDGCEIGLALLDDGKYGCDVCGSTLRVTVLRSPPYAYHIPHPPDWKRRYDWLDQGLQEFTLLLVPHVGDWREAGVVRAARALNLPLIAITTHAHAGSLPSAASLAALSAQALEVTAVKPAHDGDGYVVRLVDCHGEGGAGELRWLGESLPVSVPRRGVVTLRIRSRAGRWRAEVCDLLERPCG